MQAWRALVALGVGVVAAGAAVAATGATSPLRDHATQAWNVLPPGEAGGVAFTKNSTDQIRLYEGLTQMRDRVTNADLKRFFKRETLGLGSEKAVSVERPRRGVTITRDRWGVPHVKGDTATDVAFGAGWATAADRQLIIELLRGPGRIAALDAPGIDAFNMALSGRTFAPSAETEAFLARQFPLLARQGAKGKLAIRVIDAFVAGINAQYAKAGLALPKWTRNDVVAVAGLMGAIFGTGGGDEVRRSQFLARLEGKLGQETGRQVWEDLRQRDDPEARVALASTFPYEGRPTSESGNLVVDAGSWQPVGGTGATTTRLNMSNALLVGAKRSVSGHPLLVAGPQVGHYYPGILMELDLDGGGYRARGASFPGISFAVLLGRGIDYAWSATSAGSDVIDEYVETLCGGSDAKYLFRGECRDMTTFDAGVIKGPAGMPDQPLVYRETVHGPVVAYATVEGKKVAVTRKRSTRGRELLSARFFLDLNTNVVRSAKSFVASAATMELTFNWLYADSSAIAQFTSGRLPLRPTTVDPGLPTKGTGEHEWLGFAPPAAHAQVVNPTSGLDPQLEQQAGPELRGLRCRVDVGAGAARRPPLGGNPTSPEAHTRQRRRRDERRVDPGPAARQGLAGDPSRAGARLLPDDASDGGSGTAGRVARRRRQPHRRRPRRQGRRPGCCHHGCRLESHRRRRARADARQWVVACQPARRAGQARAA